MKLSLIAIWLFCVLFSIVAAAAIPVQYTFTMTGQNVSVTQHEEVREQCSLNDANETVCVNMTRMVNQTQEQPWNLGIVIDDTCEDICLDAMPVPELPEQVHISSYRLTEDSPAYDVTFKRSKTMTTTDREDKVKIEILGPQCTDSQCDASCVTCPDASCHPSGYACPALSDYILVQKIVPMNLTLGQNRVNVLVRNLLNRPINDVSVNISGFGLKTVDILPAAAIAGNDKDYVFLTVNATQAGASDVVIHVQAMADGQEVVSESIETLMVLRNPTNAAYNRTELASQLSDNKARLKTLELDYANKRADGYQLLDIEDTLKETKDLLLRTQAALNDEELEQASDHLARIQFNVEDMESNLGNARKPKRSISEYMKDNIFWISALITATAGALALYEKQRQKMATLKEKVKHMTTVEEKAQTRSRRKRRKSSPARASSSESGEEAP